MARAEKVSYWRGQHKDIDGAGDGISGRLLVEEDTGDVFLEYTDLYADIPGNITRRQLTDNRKFNISGGVFTGPVILCDNMLNLVDSVNAINAEIEEYNIGKDPKDQIPLWEVDLLAVPKEYVDSNVEALDTKITTHIEDDTRHIIQEIQFIPDHDPDSEHPTQYLPGSTITEREYWNQKVDYQEGKSLSENDFTDELKYKLDRINSLSTRTEYEPTDTYEPAEGFIVIGTLTIKEVQEHYEDPEDLDSLELVEVENVYQIVIPENLDIIAGQAEKLETARLIDGLSFDGTSDIHRYGVCLTGSYVQNKEVEIPGFYLPGDNYYSTLYVYFENDNLADEPKLAVNSQEAYPITYKGDTLRYGNNYIETGGSADTSESAQSDGYYHIELVHNDNPDDPESEDVPIPIPVNKLYDLDAITWFSNGLDLVGQEISSNIYIASVGTSVELEYWDDQTEELVPYDSPQFVVTISYEYIEPEDNPPAEAPEVPEDFVFTASSTLENNAVTEILIDEDVADINESLHTDVFIAGNPGFYAAWNAWIEGDYSPDLKKGLHAFTCIYNPIIDSTTGDIIDSYNYEIIDSLDKTYPVASHYKDGLMSYEDKIVLDDLHENPYELPPADNSNLGGVIIGNNITYETTGLISVTKDNVVAALGYEPSQSGSSTEDVMEGSVSAETYIWEDFPQSKNTNELYTDFIITCDEDVTKLYLYNSSTSEISLPTYTSKPLPATGTKYTNSDVNQILVWLNTNCSVSGNNVIEDGANTGYTIGTGYEVLDPDGDSIDSGMYSGIFYFSDYEIQQYDAFQLDVKSPAESENEERTANYYISYISDYINSYCCFYMYDSDQLSQNSALVLPPSYDPETEQVTPISSYPYFVVDLNEDQIVEKPDEENPDEFYELKNSSNVVIGYVAIRNGKDGKQGLVPKPLSTDSEKFLKGDGTWSFANDDSISGIPQDVLDSIMEGHWSGSEDSGGSSTPSDLIPITNAEILTVCQN